MQIRLTSEEKLYTCKYRQLSCHNFCSSFTNATSSMLIANKLKNNFCHSDGVRTNTCYAASEAFQRTFCDRSGNSAKTNKLATALIVWIVILINTYVYRQKETYFDRIRIVQYSTKNKQLWTTGYTILICWDIKQYQWLSTIYNC